MDCGEHCSCSSFHSGIILRIANVTQYTSREIWEDASRSSETLMESCNLSYSLCEKEDKWTWRLVDEMGEIVADGCAPDRRSAESCMWDALNKAQSTH